MARSCVRRIFWGGGGRRGRNISYIFVLFVNFYAIRYGDTVEQTTCTFSRSIRANGLGKLRPTQSMGRR